MCFTRQAVSPIDSNCDAPRSIQLLKGLISFKSKRAHAADHKATSRICESQVIVTRKLD